MQSTGTGKTMLVRAMAAEYNAKLLTLNGADVLAKTFGETEARMADVFKQVGAETRHVREYDCLVGGRSRTSHHIY